MGQGKTVTAEDAQRIYDLYLNGNKGEAKQLCFLLGYKKSTYYNIINNEGQVGISDQHGGVQRRWSDDQINAAIGYIEDVDPQVTL